MVRHAQDFHNHANHKKYDLYVDNNEEFSPRW